MITCLISSKQSEIVSLGKPLILIVFANAFWKINLIINFNSINFYLDIYFHTEADPNWAVQWHQNWSLSPRDLACESSENVPHACNPKCMRSAQACSKYRNIFIWKWSSKYIFVERPKHFPNNNSGDFFSRMHFNNFNQHK